MANDHNDREMTARQARILGPAFRNATRRQLEAEIARVMQSSSWTSKDHKDHLTAVDKVYHLYRKAHVTK